MVRRISGLPQDSARAQSSRTPARRPAVEPERARRRASKKAALYSSESALAACRLACPCFLRKARNSSQRMLLISAGWTVSAVTSYFDPEITAPRPRTSPGIAIFRIRVRPSLEVQDNFTWPEQMTNTPWLGAFSWNNLAPRGSVEWAPMVSNSSNASGPMAQNIRSERKSQLPHWRKGRDGVEWGMLGETSAPQATRGRRGDGFRQMHPGRISN